MIYLTVEEYRKLINGRFKAFKCTSCDGNGWYWVHEDGTKRDPKPGESLDNFYRHPCDYEEGECRGVGVRVVMEGEE